MARLSFREKQEIENIFKQDLLVVQTAMKDKLEAFWVAVQETIVEEVGIKDKMSMVTDLEKEIEELKLKLQRIREEMQHSIAKRERELIELRSTAVGEYSGPPTQEQLRDLNLLDHDAPIDGRQWYGFRIRTKLDAATALRLRDSADISKPIAAIEGIAQAVERELKFASTHEAAYAAYKKFHDLGFRDMGVELPPLLEDVKGLKGDRLLEAGLIEETRRLLPGGKE